MTVSVEHKKRVLAHLEKQTTRKPDLTLTIDEAAVLLGIGRNMAYDAARRGELPILKIGRRLLVIRHKLEEMIGLVRQVDTMAAPVVETPKAPVAEINGHVLIDLPAPDKTITNDEPKIPRADSDGLLNLKYILANASKFTRVSAIYFLTSQNEIIYIGQAVDVYARISQHIFEGTKRFSHVFMVSCEPADLDRIERAYIRKFKPRYNQMHNVIADTTVPAVTTPTSEAQQ